MPLPLSLLADHENVNAVVFFVRLSVLELPVSSAELRSGVPGVVGAVVSTVTFHLCEFNNCQLAL